MVRTRGQQRALEIVESVKSSVLQSRPRNVVKLERLELVRRDVAQSVSVHSAQSVDSKQNVPDDDSLQLKKRRRAKIRDELARKRDSLMAERRVPCHLDDNTVEQTCCRPRTIFEVSAVVGRSSSAISTRVRPPSSTLIPPQQTSSNGDPANKSPRATIRIVRTDFGWSSIQCDRRFGNVIKKYM